MAPSKVEAQGQGASGTATVPRLLVERAQATPNDVAVRHKRYGRWAPTTWREYAERVAHLAAGLRSLGVGEGDQVAIVADNSLEWLITDLATQALGAASVGVDPAIEAPQLQAILEDSGAAVVVTDSEEQYDKVTEVRAALGALRTLVVIDPRGIALDPHHTDALTFAQVEETGADATIDSLAADLDRVTSAHVATLVHERGSADRPAELTHASLLAAAEAAVTEIGLDRRTEVLSYLPLALVGERVVSLGAALSTGFVVCFGDGGATFLADMQQVQPTFVLGVPLVFEEIHRSVERRMEDASFLKRRTYTFWMARGRRLGAARREGKAGIVGRALHGVGWVVLYRPLRVKLGLLRARHALCIPGPQDPAVVEFFWALGVPVRTADGTAENTDSFLHLGERENRPSAGERESRA